MNHHAGLNSNISGPDRPTKRLKTQPYLAHIEALYGPDTSIPRRSGTKSTSVMIYGSGKKRKKLTHASKHSVGNENISEVHESTFGEVLEGEDLSAGPGAIDCLNLEERIDIPEVISVEDTPSKRRKGRPQKVGNGTRRNENNITTLATSTKSIGQETDQENVNLNNEPRLSMRSKRLDSRISKRKSASNGVQVNQKPSPNVDQDVDSSVEPPGISPVPRSTGRARKKSQKQIEAEEADTIVLSRKSKSTVRSENGMLADSRPISRFSSEPDAIHPEFRNSNAPSSSHKLTPTASKRRGRPRKHERAQAHEDRDMKKTDFSGSTNGLNSIQPRPSEPAVFNEFIQEPFDELAKESTKNLEIDRPLDESVDVLRVEDSLANSDIAATTVVSSVPVPTKKFKTLLQLTEQSGLRDSFLQLKEEIIQRLARKKLLPLVGLDSEYRKVRQLIQQTILAGEGNSMMVIGSRGSAKTTLVETAINEMKESHMDDFHVIRLNGFIHTDDKVALKEIWRQLGREMQVEEETTSRHNYADTLTSLLALLSHPNELSDEKADLTAKSVIFIIDEFDLFASHPRQTLLYNLFDIAQSRKAPIAVLGLTTRIDVTESLEKRVKSRFSHRYVYLSLPKTSTAFLGICRAALCCTSSEDNVQVPQGISSAMLSAWSAYISEVLVTESFSQNLQRIFARTKSIPQVLTSLLPAFILAPVEAPPTPKQLLTSLTSNEPPDSKLVLLHGLSLLSLALLISAARLDIALSTDAVTFAMTYDEYTSLTNRTRVVAGASGAGVLNGIAGGGRLWGREVALGAWETLCDLGLLVPVTGDGKGSDARLWRCDVSLEEISEECGRDLGPMAKWCREMAL